MTLLALLLGCGTEPAGDEPTWDVLVIGAGPAGLAAAREASDAGARVLVLEREASVGGSNAPGAVMLFAGTPEQARAGVTDAPARLLAEWPDITGGSADDPWVRRIAEEGVPRVRDWLVGMGVTFEDPPMRDDASGVTPRLHRTPVDAPSVAERLAEGTDAEVRLSTEVTTLLADDDGRVIGVEARPTGGTAHAVQEILAGAVVVATGGFLHDMERVRAIRPDLPEEQLLYASWGGSDGNGLDLLAPFEVATVNLEAIGLYAHGVARAGTDHEELVALGAGRGPWVNRTGARFMDEAARNSFRAGATRAAQDGGEVWAILDDVQLEEMRFAIPGGAETLTAADVLADGTGTQAPTLEALAEALGVPEATFAATVDAYNAFARGAAPDPWRTERMDAAPVEHAPYTAFPIGVSVAKGFGGVDVDTDGRVLREDGSPVPGLFACGELTGMAGGTLVGAYGFTGSLTAVVLGGRVAGESAAMEIARAAP